MQSDYVGFPRQTEPCIQPDIERSKLYYHSPSTDAGTAKATAACILILKLEESRKSSKRILKTDGALPKEKYAHAYIL